MGRLMPHPPRQSGPGHLLPGALPRPFRDRDRGSAARGIMLALALSSLVWIGLAVTVPRLW